MIAKISFLEKGVKRVFVSPSASGHFRAPGGSALLTAGQFIKHHLVIDNDPTLTLKDGKKYRVFHASNSNIPLVYPSIVIENYDKELEERKNSAKKMKEKLAKKREEQKTPKVKPLIPPYTLGSNSSTSGVASTGTLNFPFGTDVCDDQADEDEFVYFDDEDDGLGDW